MCPSPFRALKETQGITAFQRFILQKGKGIPQTKDDAMEIGVYNESNLLIEIAFDHRLILSEYFKKVF